MWVDLDLKLLLWKPPGVLVVQEVPGTPDASKYRYVAGNLLNGFLLTPNTQIKGGVRDTTAITLEHCQLACIQRSRCTGLDWNRLRSECWLHNDNPNGCDRTLQRPYPDTDHYEYITNCMIVVELVVFIDSFISSFFDSFILLCSFVNPFIWYVMT